ncbi:MAG: glycosyltransferase [Nitrosarchaeum sp.]|nr:glycosyltransferase [Nitrosarchaeum sp.]
MKVSIVIPVYNTERYIEKCIKSALNQTYDDIEVIVVDDGSTDSTASILQKFENTIKIISKKNGGTASALNQGIKNMSGQWFKWLSADDMLKNTAVEKLILEINNIGKDAENFIFYSNYDLIDENDHVIDTFKEPNHNSLDSFQRNVILLDHFYGNGTTSIMHKSIFEKCGLFDEYLGYKDDYEFWLRCCMIFNFKLHLVPESLAQYRIHKEQLTKKRYDDALEKIEQIKAKTLCKLSPEMKSKYMTALKKYQKQKSLKTKIKKFSRTMLFKTLPKKTSNKILETYLNKKSNYKQ